MCKLLLVSLISYMRYMSLSIGHMRNKRNEDSVARPQQFPIKKLVGFDQEMMDAIDSYRRDQPAIPNISEAIRDLLQEVLRDKGYLPK